MSTPIQPRIPLFARLPEVHRTYDAEQQPPGQLRALVTALENVFGGIHENIESLYHDLFIETCDDWVVPYIGGLLGVQPLGGVPRHEDFAGRSPEWIRRQMFHRTSEACSIPLLLDPEADDWKELRRTLRADVAGTIALRRRKGTAAAVERLAATLTGWAAHVVELREKLVWSQHLNHLRPDAGGTSPWSGVQRVYPRGGTIPLRSPAALSLLGSPFDAAARHPDFRPLAEEAYRPNLPNAAIFFWRLQAFTVPPIRPFIDPLAGVRDVTAVGEPLFDATRHAAWVVAADIDALSLPATGVPPRARERPVRLFNTWRPGHEMEPAVLTSLDAVPGPMPGARLTSSPEDERPPEGEDIPDSYVTISTYDPSFSAVDFAFPSLETSETGLQICLPQEVGGVDAPWQVPGHRWTTRGACLCAWENGLHPRIGRYEIVIDPEIGRILIGVPTEPEADAIKNALLVRYTYGFPGPLGAHPIGRDAAPTRWPARSDQPPVATVFRPISGFIDPKALEKALAEAVTTNAPLVIEIRDSLVHELDLQQVTGAVFENARWVLPLAFSLFVRAGDGHRPVIRLKKPLGFRPKNIRSTGVPGTPTQGDFDAVMKVLTVRLEGLFITRDADVLIHSRALINRAAVAALEIIETTLDPGGFALRPPMTPGDPLRSPIGISLKLVPGHGLSSADSDAFTAAGIVPDVVLQRCHTGPLLLDDPAFQLSIKDSIVDAGAGVDDDASAAFALSSATDPGAQWAPASKLDGVTFLGQVRVFEVSGQGVVFTHKLHVRHNQHGCMKFSYFSGEGDRRAPNHACVFGPGGVDFTSEWSGDPGYAQLSRRSASEVLTRGPGDDAMGAWGFLLEAHKRANFGTRLREFMPLGVRPLVVPVT